MIGLGEALIQKLPSSRMANKFYFGSFQTGTIRLGGFCQSSINLEERASRNLLDIFMICLLSLSINLPSLLPEATVHHIMIHI